MAISAGDRVPSVNLKELTSEGIQDVATDELFGGKKTVIFAVPGAFTPLCSAQHLPGFIDHADAILAKGADQIVCVAVNDPFVMDCWGQDRGAGDKVRLLSDGNAEFARAIGLEMDGSGAGLGTRCKRFAAIVDDGVVSLINVDERGFEGSKAETILAAL
ncbi:MAG: peroxiredoxin [Proteobacteria bacterium]|nr:peroxiredoxin [Pseudomonadota bacterium]